MKARRAALVGENRQSAIAKKWQKGGPSPNPGGRPREVREVAELARQCTTAAIVTLMEIMRKGVNEGARIRAAEVLLDRAWGKPAQSVEVTGKEGGPIEYQQAREELASIISGLAARAAKAQMAEVAD